MTVRPVSREASDDAPVLQVQDVSKTFGRRGTLALQGVSVQVSRGDVLGIVGESGSGKSTLVRIMTGLLDPTHGRVDLLGVSPQHASAKQLGALRRHVQVVLQDPIGSLNRRKTVLQNVALPLRVYEGGRSRDHVDRVVAALEMVGLSATFLTRYPHQLSGGQAQRVSIARAISVEPEVVFFDEAISALDVSLQAQVMNLMKDLQVRLRMTYVFVAHDLGAVGYMSSHVLVMRDGRAVEYGTRQEVFGSPTSEYTRELLSLVPSLPHRGNLISSLDHDKELE